MSWPFFLSAILFMAGGVFSSLRHLQMLQQNSYYPSRYINWLKTAFSKRLVYSLVFLCLSVVLIFTSQYILLLVVAATELIIRLYVSQNDQKKSIKKLVYTARVKRMIAAILAEFASYLIILIVLYSIFASADFRFTASILYLFLLIPIHFPALIALYVYWFMAPIERAISTSYINDAKKILSNHKNLRVIGVTGSFGKTGFKFILNRLLSEKYNVVATPESFNTPMGIVRTVRERLRPDTEIFIAEMGAKNIGDIKELCEIANPTIGVITAVGPQHLDTFKSLENIQKTKFELADHCKAAGGELFVNFDSTPAKEAAINYSALSYGTEDGCTFKAENIVYSKDGTNFDIVSSEYRIPVKTKLLGKHNVINIVGAAAVALHLNVNANDIKYGVSQLNSTPHRLELKGFLNGSILIDDAYNANPVGCLEAVNVLASFGGMKKVIVTPGLVELGEKEYEYNFKLGEAAAEKCDIIILVGEKRAIPMKDAIEKSSFEKENMHIVKSFKDAMALLHTITDKDTVVLFENDLPDNYAG